MSDKSEVKEAKAPAAKEPTPADLLRQASAMLARKQSPRAAKTYQALAAEAEALAAKIDALG